MKAPAISQLERRMIEAEIMDRMRAELAAELGEERALALLRRASQAAARDAGAAFARTAPGGPSLVHFQSILERWREGNALDIEDVRLDGDELTFSITRCEYVAAYRAMGLTTAMTDAVSCCRDFGFIQGYSPRLSLEREETIAAGRPACRFRFVWKD